MLTGLGLALGALIGLSLGLLGGGGSILTVPIFVYVLGVAAKPAIAMSLPVVGGTSLVGAAGHWRKGHVDVPVALGFGLVAMAAAYGGARLGVLVPARAQLVLLAIVMVVVAAAMLRGRRDEAREGQGRAPLWQILLAGIVVGTMTGLVGIGGGFLVVPALVFLARLPMKRAIGTSLVVIALNSASGLLGYLGRVPIDWGMTAAFTAIAGTGVLLGAVLAGRVPAAALRRGFAVFVLAMGVFVLYRNRSAFSPQSATAAVPGGAAAAAPAALRPGAVAASR